MSDITLTQAIDPCMSPLLKKGRKRKKKKVASPTENQKLVEDMMIFMCNEECKETGKQKRLFK